MADGAAAATVDNFLAQFLNGTASTIVLGGLYCELHIGAPGAAGTANPALNTTREAAGTFTAPSGGSASNTAAITWTSVPDTETYTDVALWTAATGGTFVASGTITGGAVQAGNTFTIPIGDLVVSMPVAS